MSSDVASTFQKHCPGCFQLKGGTAVCPHCGYDESSQRSPLFLPHGMVLGGQYRVGRVLGRPGGFGITYLGWDVNLQQRVAIKEYLPREIAQRMPHSLEVNVHTADDKRGFEFGKEQFLREARIVAKLDHPNIVRVRNFFNANATAYLVMDYYEGMSLGDYLGTVRNKLEPELAVPLVKPILEGLQYVHERGLVHRDLKPHNIYLAAIGRPIVLDFGAARQAAGDRVQSLSVVLTEGYAPLEQYQRRAVQGPWTDVYGVAATLYRMIVGTAPPIALDRIGRDPVEDGGWTNVPPTLVPALRMALAVRPSDRYQSAVEFLAALERFLGGTTATTGLPPPEKLTASMPFVPLIDEPPPQHGAPVTDEAPPTVAQPPRPAIVDRVAAPPPRAMPRPAAPAVPAPGGVVNPPRPLLPAAGPAASAMPSALPESAAAAAVASGRAEARTAPRAEAFVDQRRAEQPPLYRRATDIKPAPPPPPKARWLPWVLLLGAAAAAGYVLLNPPGKPAPRARPAVAAVAPAAPAPAVVAPAGPAAELPAESAAVPEVALQVPAMVALPGGSLRLQDEDEARDSAVGSGVRTVRVAPVKMGRTEVTVAQFRDFVKRTGYDNPRWQNYPCESAGGRLPDWQDPGYSQSDDSPVVCVSWADANAYTQWLTRETGQSYRLPSEAEWEYAARAGTTSRYWWGSNAGNGMAICQSCPPKLPTQPAIAASTPPNPFGLYETLGNVREWTCSRFESYATDSAERCGSIGEGARAAVRGGSWQQSIDALVVNQREAYEPYRRNVWTGFRVAQELTATAAP